MPKSNRLLRFAPSGRHQDAHHNGKINHILPQRPLHFRLGHVEGRFSFGLFFLAK